jgi:hypothetical protein
MQILERGFEVGPDSKIRREKPKTARDRKFATRTWLFDGRWVISKIVLRGCLRSSEDDSLRGRG